MKRITIVVFALLIAISCRADMFTRKSNNNVNVNTANTVKKQTTRQKTIKSQKPVIFSQKKEDKIKQAVKQYINRNPQYFQKVSACQCSSCKTNNVYFYFLEDRFTAQDIRHAVALAKSHNLNPIINIETKKNLQTKNDFINEFYKIKNKLPILNSEMSLEHNQLIIKKIKQAGGKGYFKFDSIDGLKLGGKIEKFNYLYNIAFGK